MPSTTFSPGTVVTSEWLNEVNDFVFGNLDNIVSVTDYGADPTGVADSTAAIQEAVADMIATGKAWKVIFPSGTYLVSGEIDLSTSTQPFFLEGTRYQTVIKATGYGAEKAVFKCPEDLRGQIRGFVFGDGTASRAHPIGIYIPRSGRVKLDDINSSGWGNTVVWASRVFNAEWANFDLFFSGQQPVFKTVPTTTTLSITSGSAVVTASASVFAAGDVGQYIHIGGSTADNDAFVAQISAYTSATQVTLDRVMPETGTGRRFSFLAVTGAITSGAAVLTTAADYFVPGDVGRFVYVEGAGTNGGILTSRISAYTSATQVTLADNASTTVTVGQVYLTPSIYIGGYEIDPGETPINDLVLSNILIEGFRGPGIIVQQGLHVFFNNLKLHGRSRLGSDSFSDFGASCYPFYISGTNRLVINTLHVEFCGPPRTDSGYLKIDGGEPGVNITSAVISGACNGEYLFDFRPVTTATASLDFGALSTRIDWSLFRGLVYTNTNAAKRRVSASGRTSGSDFSTERSFQTPLVVGSVRPFAPVEIANGASITFKPASNVGLLYIGCEDSANLMGLFSYRIDPGVTAAMTKLAGGSNSSNTLGTASNVNLEADATTGLITIENLSGTRFYHVGIIG